MPELDDTAAPATALDRLLAAGIAEDRARDHFERGRVRVAGEVVSDPRNPRAVADALDDRPVVAGAALPRARGSRASARSPYRAGMSTAVFIRVSFRGIRSDQVGTVQVADVPALEALEADLAAHPRDTSARTTRVRVDWANYEGNHLLMAAEIDTLQRVGGAAPGVGEPLP